MPDWIEENSRVAVDTTSESSEEIADCVNVNGWKEFQLSICPTRCVSFALNAAGATGADVAYVASALLVTIGAAIGTTRQVRCKGGWDEFPHSLGRDWSARVVAEESGAIAWLRSRSNGCNTS